MSETHIEPTGTPPDGKKSNWIYFWIALLLPAVLAFLTATVQRPGDASAWVVVVGSGFSGLFCGIFLTLRSRQPTGWRVVVALFLVPLMYAVSFFIGFLGCAGGSQLHG